MNAQPSKNEFGSAIRPVQSEPGVTSYEGWDNRLSPTQSKNHIAKYWQKAPPVPDEPAMQPVLPQQDVARQINAQVAAVNTDGVLFNCLLPGREVTIQLPRALVAEHLQKLGQPVTIELGRQNGVRVPQIRARDVAPVHDEFDDAVDAWLDRR